MPEIIKEKVDRRRYHQYNNGDNYRKGNG